MDTERIRRFSKAKYDRNTRWRARLRLLARYLVPYLPDTDTHRPAFPETVLTTATLERTGIIFHLPHGLFLCHLQTTQPAVLDTGNRVAILYAPAVVSTGDTPGCMACQTGVSAAHDC